MPIPAQRTAFDVPIEVFLVPIQADVLVSKVVKQGRTGFTAILYFRLERQQAESQVCQAKFRTELTQTVIETGAPDLNGQTSASSRSISAFKANLQVSDKLEGNNKVLVIWREIIYIFRQIDQSKNGIQPTLPEDFFHRKDYHPTHAILVEILLLA